ncbi:MAG: PAC2 family protein [Chloroflexota bacterium]|nr:PAC2 family protein [Chloroflexota bacterium]
MNIIKADGEWPELKNSILVAAFSGWNDAADAATSAVRYLGEQVSTETFATLDPEEFYVFTETRPQTRLNEDGEREIIWPTNEFAAQSNLPGLKRSLVTLIGVEPDLKWRTFADTFIEICRRCNVTEVVLVGALVAPVPHTRPVPITGAATDPLRLERVRKVGISGSRYEGPTGIVGILSERCQHEKIPLISFWGAAPSYLTASPNWKVTSGLLDALNLVLNLELELSSLHAMSRRFESQVTQAVNRDEQVAAFVQALEEQYAMDEGSEGKIEALPEEEEDENDTELPSAELLIQDLERHIRQRQERNDRPSEEN